MFTDWLSGLHIRLLFTFVTSIVTEVVTDLDRGITCELFILKNFPLEIIVSILWFFITNNISLPLTITDVAQQLNWLKSNFLKNLWNYLLLVKKSKNESDLSNYINNDLTLNVFHKKRIKFYFNTLSWWININIISRCASKIVHIIWDYNQSITSFKIFKILCMSLFNILVFFFFAKG